VQNPVRLWAFPERGSLAAVHNAILSPTTGLLSYGHSLGASASAIGGTEGSIGLALYQGPETSPLYVADLVDSRFGFIREAQEDGDALLVTDSGCQSAKVECAHEARILRVAIPELSTSDLSGAWSTEHEQQKLFAAEILSVEVEGPLRFPYEADR
jgi:hypothetical protein